MSLVGVRVEVPTNQPIVLLREEDGQRYLPIFIGNPEATAIVYALQGMDTPRPMTHDLFKTVLDEMAVRLQRVIITELHDGTFYAEIEQDDEEAEIEEFREFLNQVQPEDFASE
jgi:bifunctional DNase/RNase